LRDEDLVTRSRELGIEIKTYLESKLLSKPPVNQILGKGLMLAIEGKEAMFGVGLMNQLRRSGVIAIPCGKNGRSLALTPSLNIPKDELYEAVDRIINLV
jgi:acetylornithine/succinyldiaminopimelate/putrescine aminotransferase